MKYTMPIMFRLQTPAPAKEEAASIQHINLKVDKDASIENVDAVKEFFKNRNNKGTSITTTLMLGEGRKNNMMWVHGAEGKSPLIVVDGEVKGNGTDILSKISPDQIQSITVLKDATAVAEFGDKAKDGVIKITTEKKEN